MDNVNETTPFVTPVKSKAANKNERLVYTDRKLFPIIHSLFPAPKSFHSRLIDRDGDFNQSKGKLFIRKLMIQSESTALYSHDWFHSLMDAPTSRSVFLLMMCYFSVVTIFAIIYYGIAITYVDCNLGMLNFLNAFVFSLQTMATIGFGVGEGDIFFGDCVCVATTLSCQIFIKIICDAVIIGVIYSRISRPNKRASTILFSDSAIIRRIRDRVYFMFQLCELRKHQLTEAHVRLYAVRHERDAEIDGEVTYFQTCSMRLNHPNDDLGANLLLCLPQVVVHELDATSPMVPPRVWATATQLHRWERGVAPVISTPPRSPRSGLSHSVSSSVCDPEYSIHSSLPVDSADHSHDYAQFPEIIPRDTTPRSSGKSKPKPGFRSYDINQNMSMNVNEYSSLSYQHQDNSNNRNATLPTVSSITSNSPMTPQSQVTSSAAVHHNGIASSTSIPVPMSGMMLDEDREIQLHEQSMIDMYMRDRCIEIIAIVEGTDATTGGVVQARHSYTCSDIEWNKMFVPCVFPGDDGSAVIDFSKFHTLRQVSMNAANCGAVQSHI